MDPVGELRASGRSRGSQRAQRRWAGGDSAETPSPPSGGWVPRGSEAEQDWLAEIYEAAADGTRWARALGAAAGRLGARRAAMEVIDLSGGGRWIEARGEAGWQVRPASLAANVSGLAPAPPWPALAVHLEGRTASCRFPLHGTTSVARLSLTRSSGSRSWSEPDCAAIALVASHLERALRLALRGSGPAPAGPNRGGVRSPSAPAPAFWREVEAELLSERGLTPCEARVAVRFAQGGSVRQVAHRLHVSVETVRTHLKRIYQKLGTTRQAELVHLLLTKERAPHDRHSRED